MLSLQKSATDQTGLGYDFSFPSISSTSTTIFVSPTNNVESENNGVKNVLASKNIDKVKSILGALPKLDKKENKNPRAKKRNTQKPKQKNQHLCHHCGATGHTWPNCYKWLATQQSNSMGSPGNQNQFPSSFAPLGDLLKALMFLSNLNGFNSSPSPPDQGFVKQKGSSKVWKEKGSKWFSHFFSLPFLFFEYALLVCFAFLFWVSLVYTLLCSTCFCWMTIETRFSKLCIIYSLDKHLYAQLSKWALWLVFVMSKIK